MTVAQPDPARPDHRAAYWRQRCRAQRVRECRCRAAATREISSKCPRSGLSRTTDRMAAALLIALREIVVAAAAEAMEAPALPEVATAKAAAERHRSSQSAAYSYRRRFPTRLY